MKIPRPDGEVHVYLYHEGSLTKAAVYVRGGVVTSTEPVHTFTGGSEMGVEQEARAWVEANFPRGA